MYLGVDIGGTKTLVAVLDDDGTITEKARFPTPKTYAEFMQELGAAVAGFTTKNLTAAAFGVPGRLDRGRGRVIGLGNLEWQDIPLQDDAAKLLNCPVVSKMMPMSPL